MHLLEKLPPALFEFDVDLVRGLRFDKLEVKLLERVDASISSASLTVAMLWRRPATRRFILRILTTPVKTIISSPLLDRKGRQIEVF